MYCLRLDTSRPIHTCFQLRDNVYVLRLALAIIAVCAFTVLMCSIVSYLPPSAGYCGGVVCLFSFTSLVVCSVCNKRHRRPAFDPLPTLEQPASVAPPIDTLPDEVLIYIFCYLSRKELAKASLVCKRWKLLTADDQLWKGFCLQEMIVPPEGMVVPATSYKKMYYDCKILEKNILHGKFRKTRLKLPDKTRLKQASIFEDTVSYFFKTKDKIFLHNGKRFEIWDSSLRVSYLKEPIDGIFSYDNFLCGPYSNFHPPYGNFCHLQEDIKVVDHIIYLIEDKERSSIFEDKVKLNDEICIYSFNNLTNQQLPTIRFRLGEDKILQKRFELDKDRIFVGRNDGSIVIWNLKRVSAFAHLFIYGESAKWDEAKENIWIDSYKNEQLEEMKKTWPFDKRRNFEINGVEVVDEEQRNLINSYFEYHHTLQNRIWLKGHTASVTGLCVVDSFLFSVSDDGTMKKWDFAKAQCVWTIKTESGGFTSLRIAGPYIFGGHSRSSQVCQWDCATGRRRAWIDWGKDNNVHSFHVIGNLLFCVIAQKNSNSIYSTYPHIAIFNLFTHKQIKSFEHDTPTLNPCMQILDNRLYLLAEYRQVSILEWDFSSSTEHHSLFSFMS